MSLRVKTLIPLLIVALVGCLSIGFLASTVLKITTKNNQAMESALIADSEALKVHQNLTLLIGLTERVVSMTKMISEQEIKASFEIISDALSSNIAELESHTQADEVIKRIDDLRLELKAMQQDTAILIGVTKSSEIPTQELFNRHVTKVNHLASLLVIKTRENARKFMGKSATDMYNALVLTALAMVSFIACTTFLAFRSANKSSKAIIHAVGEIIKLAGEIRTNGTKKLDEIEQMQSSLIILKKSLKEKQKIAHALGASKEQFKALFAHAPVGMALIDETASFTRVNTALCDFLGYSESDIIAKKYWDFMLPSETPELSTIYETLKNEEQVSYQDEFQFINKNGRVVWGLTSISLEKNMIGKRDRFIAQIQDITEIKELEKIKSEFIATVSHELRTPLTSIKGAVALIQGTMKNQLDDATLRMLNIASSNCERLSSLVNDILDMEKISSKNLELHFMDEDLKLLTESSVENMLPYALENEVSIECELPKDNPIVWADKKRLEQVIVNLLSNAAKFSRPDTKIQVSLSADDKYAKVAIRDSGIGISEEQGSKLFKPFSQIDSSASRKTEGTGLGLYITKQIVEQMYGQIGFSSVEGSYTVFWFTVPLATKAKAVMPAMS